MNQPCRICENAEPKKQFDLCERQFGTGEPFRYFQCPGCACLQIETIPEDLGRFYPRDYYSCRAATMPQTGLKSRLAAWRDRLQLTGRGWMAGPLLRKFPGIYEVQRLGELPLRPGMSILDVGCGNGGLLSSLWRAGFRDIAGVDPFLSADREVTPGLWVRRQPVEAVQGRFDLVMLHHVLEHVVDGLAMLRACKDRLRPGGRILVRIPVLGGAAWEQHREYWVGLDAPRHICLHTKKSMEILAQRAGLRLASWRGECSRFHFYASEFYRRGLPLFDADGHETSLSKNFTPAEIAQFDKAAADAFATGKSDQVAALLVSA
jgi:SAM-dependent methyltransferase